MSVIILEGPDGSGKTTAIKELSKALSVPVLDRASTSLDGPVEDLPGWVEHFASKVSIKGSGQVFNGLLDRHPLISELIYGPMVRAKLPDRFTDPYWMRDQIRDLANKATIVWCLPSIDVVRVNVSDDDSPQMSGVQAHIDELYYAYHGMAAHWRGTSFWYDYTKPAAFTKLRHHVEYLMEHA